MGPVTQVEGDMRQNKCPVEYSLEYQVRRDEDAKAYIAYIPMLQLYTCSQTEPKLKDAIHDLVVNFVTICRDRGILDEVMRRRGLLPTSGRVADDLRREARAFGKGQDVCRE